MYIPTHSPQCYYYFIEKCRQLPATALNSNRTFAKSHLGSYLHIVYSLLYTCNKAYIVYVYVRGVRVRTHILYYTTCARFNATLIFLTLVFVCISVSSCVLIEIASVCVCVYARKVRRGESDQSKTIGDNFQSLSRSEIDIW